MSDFAIQIENLGKLYFIGAKQDQVGSLYSTLVDTVTGPLRRASRLLHGQATGAAGLHEKMWALKDLTLDVKRGEVVGIIGRNGAGKSTLLKILSRITLPSEGRVKIYGRVGSLLEVGTGFHQELTGRENIYLNGAILGMRRAEISRKFDEIVDFAGVDKFIDTPVKHYSSGMYLRLGFAVAAHLEPDILLVDEVLAVGDFEFQKKCLGKMSSVASAGRTVLFVSHNMPAVQRLCSKAYLLEHGKMIQSGSTAHVVDAYYRLTMGQNEGGTEVREAPEGTVRFQAWHTDNVENPNTIYTGDACTFSFDIVIRRNLASAHFGIAIWSDDGTLVWNMRSMDRGGESLLGRGKYQINFILPQLPLRPGWYQLQVTVVTSTEGILDMWYPQQKLQVLPRGGVGISNGRQGVLVLDSEFSLQLIGKEHEPT